MKLVQSRNRRILFIMAAPPEYGPALRARFTPLMTGVGPVEAGLAVGATLARLETRGETPDLAVCLGSAGSRSLEQTGVYQVASVSYRDIDASPLGIPAGLTPYLDLPRELPLQVLLPDLPAVRLSTGGAVISGAAYDAIDADMVDMETFAVARACMTHGVPLAGLRGVSDGAADLNRMDDWQAYLHIIDEKLAAVVDRILAAAAN
ncbi:MAG: 5'-methylthioadenosine/S-adenosylhomocysteine nucleosidase [Phenylobacterium sp.]|nr:5'-methylthioadenosine/S-adenosylhomocysteine nucleosidase [Phenylobacterium sp.]